MNNEYSSKSIELPVVNGILYSDGSIEHYCICEDENFRRYIKKTKSEQNDLISTSIAVTDEQKFEDIDLMVAVGEGSWGGDGFIIAEKISSGNMLWLISFDNSNPFISLKRYNDKLYIENNLYEIWEIDIQSIAKPTMKIIQQSEFFNRREI